MRRLKQFLGFDIGQYPGERSPTEELKLQYIILSSRFGFLICVLVTAISYFNRGLSIDIALGLYWAAVLLLTPFHIKRGVVVQKATRVQGISFLVFVICLIANDLDPTNGRIFWAYIFPPIAFFVHGKKEALGGSLFLLIVSGLLLEGVIGGVSFDLMYKIRFVITFSMVIGATYGVELCREAAFNKMYGIQQDYAKKVEELMASQSALKVIQQKAVDSAKLATLGEMAGGIAHEINNPLMVISGNAKLIKKRLLAGDSKPIDLIKYADRVTETVGRMELVVRGLKSFIRAGKNDPYDAVSLSKIIQEAISLAREKIVFAQIDFNVDDIPTDIFIQCRETEILQVILNLLENAIDAVRERQESWIRLSFKNSDSRVEFAISDNGGGIPAAIQDDIFKPFFTTKKVGKGTGLGLSITRDIVERHKGTVYISDSGPHTKVVVELPKV